MIYFIRIIIKIVGKDGIVMNEKYKDFLDFLFDLANN